MTTADDDRRAREAADREAQARERDPRERG